MTTITTSREVRDALKCHPECRKMDDEDSDENMMLDMNNLPLFEISMRRSPRQSVAGLQRRVSHFSSAFGG